MDCPSDDLLFLVAEDALPEGPLEPNEAALLEGWDPFELRSHVTDCASCVSRLDASKQTLEGWRGADPAANERFDDAYFASMADEIVAAVPSQEGSNVVRFPGFSEVAAVVFAAAAVILVMVLLRPPMPEATQTALAPIAPPSDTELTDGSLESQARALGLDLLADFDDEGDIELLEGDAPVIAKSNWYAMADLAAASDAWEDDLLPAGGSLFDELDALDADQLDNLFLQL
jgi:hypothetical protein